MYRVTYESYSRALDKTFTNVETHKSIDDARLRGLALNWHIVKVEPLPMSYHMSYNPKTKTWEKANERQLYKPIRYSDDKQHWYCPTCEGENVVTSPNQKHFHCFHCATHHELYH
jgi:hypothetical protein